MPAPLDVAKSLYNDAGLLWEHSLVTLTEMLLGLLFGVLLVFYKLACGAGSLEPVTKQEPLRNREKVAA